MWGERKGDGRIAVFVCICDSFIWTVSQIQHTERTREILVKTESATE